MRFPGGIPMPAFCVHTYFAPGGVSFTVDLLRSRPPPACARDSTPFVSIHTLLELGAQYTFGTGNRKLEPVKGHRGEPGHTLGHTRDTRTGHAGAQRHTDRTDEPPIQVGTGTGKFISGTFTYEKETGEGDTELFCYAQGRSSKSCA
jgi:hypothetical protein